MLAAVPKLTVMGDFETLFNSLDPNEQKRGFEFEHVCKWFLQNDPTYASRLKRIWLWKEWPGRWRSGEAGIDLVAEDTGGKLWAIQSKAYGEDKPIPKSELDKFLSESNRKEFAYRLLISTTTNGLHHNAQETVAAQEKPVLIVDLLDLRDSPVDWPGSLSDLRPARPREPAQPREHQDEAILDVLGGFESHDRGQLIMACGTGKTLTAWFINEKLAAQRTLVLVPSLSLLKQTMREWERAAGGQVRFASMPVCSDASVSSTEDPGLAYTAELGVPAQTDPEEIAKFLRGRGPRVVFSTYHSSPQIAKAFELGRVPAFDFVVVDEAHRVAGRVSSDFATVLDAGKIKARKRLFMTATPRVYSAATKKAAKDENFEQASMDDRDQFGPVFHKLGFGEAIERKLLTDYRVAIIGVNDAMYHDWTQRGTFVTFDGKTPVTADKAAGQIGLAKAMREFDLRRTISFHSRVSRAAKFAASMQPVIDWMPKKERPAGTLWTGYASGEMDAGKRARLIQHLADLDDADRGLLTNARCLAEGVDVPTLDGVAFIDPRRSEVDIVQAVGRAIRKSDNKKLGTIVIPVFIKDTDDPEAALDDSAFKPVWDVLRALRSHDDELGRQLDTLRREMGSEGRTTGLPAKIYADIPKSIGAAFAEAFRIRLVEQTTTSWEFWFGLLQKYIAENGTSRVSHSEESEGYKLGGWVAKQRAKYGDGGLSHEKRQLLESLPGWSWAALVDRWDESFARLVSYVAANGTALVPNSTVWQGFRLGGWINKQRGDYRSGDIDPVRQSRLEALPGWSWDVNKYRWEEGFRYLSEYVAKHGNARVAAEYMVNGYSLGKWVFKQRSSYRLGLLDPERVRRLEVLPGWVWKSHADKWDKFYGALEEYARLTGSADVASTLTIDGLRVGAWVQNQRNLKIKGQLDDERALRLEQLPGWLWKRDFTARRWEEGFRRLDQYVELNGDSRVPDGYRIEEYTLGTWVQKQRATYQEGRLKKEYAHRLEALRGWIWESVRDERWELGLQHLEEFVQRNGNARVAAKCVFNGYRLGTWVNSQRTRYAEGSLEVERIRRLESVSGWAWDARADIWEEGFQHLSNYVAEHGDSRVPKPYMSGDFRLGQWVGVQRSNNNRGNLCTARRERLEALPGWSWDVKTDLWLDGYRRLKSYTERHGELPTQSYAETDGYKLGSWVTTQRDSHTNGRLDDEQIQLIAALPGWTWNTRDTKWECGYQRLTDYTRRNPNAALPAQACIDPDGYKLGSWVIVQRTNRDKGTLSDERQERLEALPGWSWEPLAEAWEQHYQELLDYVAKQGTSRVPQSHTIKGFRLGGWVQKQRSGYRKGRLNENQQHRLESLPDWRWGRFEDGARSKRLSGDEKADLRRLAAAGTPIPELAAKFGIGRSTAHRLATSDS